MNATDCFLGLIGWSDGSNACLPQIPTDRNTSRSGLFMDAHPAFTNALVLEPKGSLPAQFWPLVTSADAQARLELVQIISGRINRKVKPVDPFRVVSIGEDTGNGYHTTFTQPAKLLLPTKNVPDASFVLTHIGIKALSLNGQQTVNVVLKKNGTALQAWQVTFTNDSLTRSPLPVPYELALDGSVYSLEYAYTAQVFPSKNSLDCGCDGVRAAYTCFFEPFTGDAAGLRLLGEIRCNDLLLPCLTMVRGGLVGMTMAKLYQALLVLYLLGRLDAKRNAFVTAQSLIGGDALKGVINGLTDEINGQIELFDRVYEPLPSCCFTHRTQMDKFVSDNGTQQLREFHPNLTAFT